MDDRSDLTIVTSTRMRVKGVPEREREREREREVGVCIPVGGWTSCQPTCEDPRHQTSEFPSTSEFPAELPTHTTPAQESGAQTRHRVSGCSVQVLRS